MTKGNYLELMAIRRALASLAAELAAEKMSVEEIEALKERSLRTWRAIEAGEFDDALEGNHAFFDLICRGAKSVNLEQMLNGLWLRLGPSVASTLRGVFAQKAEVARGLILVTEIIEALEARDASRAKRSTEDALAAMSEMILKHSEFEESPA